MINLKSYGGPDIDVISTVSFFTVKKKLNTAVRTKHIIRVPFELNFHFVISIVFTSTTLSLLPGREMPSLSFFL